MSVANGDTGAKDGEETSSSDLIHFFLTHGPTHAASDDRPSDSDRGGAVKKLAAATLKHCAGHTYYLICAPCCRHMAVWLCCFVAISALAHLAALDLCKKQRMR